MKVEVVVLGSPSLIVRRVSVDVKQHRRRLKTARIAADMITKVVFCVQASASLSIQLDPLWLLGANTSTEFASLTEPHFRSRAAMER